MGRALAQIAAFYALSVGAWLCLDDSAHHRMPSIADPAAGFGGRRAQRIFIVANATAGYR